MYAPSYGGFGQMNTSQPFNPNGGLQQPQNPHQHQQQHQQHQHQQHQQQQQQPGQPQHMMYNSQAYPPGPQQAPYGTPGPVMGGNAGGMGMMQNNGLAHVPGGPMAQYQTPYTSSPYGTSIPTPTSNLPQGFMPATMNAQTFAMNTSNMNPQQSRMQPPPTTSTPTQRASPYGGMQQGTPPHTGNALSQFSTPGTNQTTIQTSNPGQAVSMGTPQTPNFPPGSAGATGQVLATPLSPGSEHREKERVSVLLLINSELLMESLRLQTVQAAEKEKEVAGGASDEAAQKERAEKGKVLGREYVECMRRLQGNLAYLAAIADRHHKPSSQIPSHPQLISAPPLTPRSAPSSSSPKNSDASPSDATKSKDVKDEKKEGGTIGDVDDVDRPERLKELYIRLQGLFPGVDPKKEQSMQQINQAAMRARQQQAQAQAQAQVQAGQGHAGLGNINPGS